MERVYQTLQAFFCATLFALFAFANPALLLAPSAHANPIVSIGGDISLIPAPADARQFQLTSDTTMFFWEERKGVELALPLSVDAPGLPGFYTFDTTNPTTIGAGTIVNSYILHSDNPIGPVIYSGSVTFSEEILGFIFLDDSLTSTDSLLGAPTTIYPSTGCDTENCARGFESISSPEVFDQAVLSSTRRTSTAVFQTAGFIDELRIVTQASPVPEPEVYAMMGVGLALLGWVGRRKKLKEAAAA